MDSESIRRIGRMLTAVADLAGAPVIWRYPPELGQLPEAQYLHCGAFCLAVKTDPRRYAACRHAESVELAAACRQHGRPYRKVCFAGVGELAVPIHDGARLVGVLLCGPFRLPETSPAAPDLQATYAALPVWPKARLRQTTDLLIVLADYIALAARIDFERESRPRVHDARIERALLYLGGNFRQPLHLAEVARHCALSPSRFGHLFTQECGESFGSRLNRLRVTHAERLLLESDAPLGEVARECGFYDQSHFGAAFKAQTGQTPGQYRRARRRLP